MADALDGRRLQRQAIPTEEGSLLKKLPTWVTSLDEEEEEDEDEEGVDLFSRAKELYPIRVAEEERQRQKKLEEVQRKRSTIDAERKPCTSSTGKRRRLSSQTNDYSSNSPPTSVHNDEPSSYGASPQSSSGKRSSRTKPSTTLSERYTLGLNTEKQENPKTVTTNPAVVSLSGDSDDEDADHEAPIIKKLTSQPIVIDDDDDDHIIEEEEEPVSDEEFPELVQKAREREQRKALERLNMAKSTEQAHSLHGGSNAVDTADDLFRDSNTPVIDPVVEILVTSVIPDSKPTIFRRKISQPFKPVRLAWIDKQAPGLPELKAPIFLTWRGKRLFDVSTCAFLGIKAGIGGDISAADNTLDGQGRLHLEAWTESLYMEYQMRGQQEGGDKVQDNDEPVKKIKLLLKSKEMAEPLRVKVKPTTLIQKLISSVLNSQDVPAGKDVLLYFDGDKLDPGSSVADTELGDLDTIEIHYR